MKPFISRLAAIAGPLLFPLYFILHRKKKKFIVSMLVVAVILTGCFQHYFQTNTKKTVDAATVQKLLNADKYFIIHFNNGSVKALQNVSVTTDKLEADISEVTADHSKFLSPNTKNINEAIRVKKVDMKTTLTEVHFYTTNELTADQRHISFPLSSFSRLDVYTFDQKATTINHVLSIVGVTLVGATVVLLIAVAIACNCPQVFVNNNGQYEFVSGVYSGAIYSSLERTDYLPLLSSAVVDNTYRLKIANVKNEEQFINREQLLQVNHPIGTNVLVDRHGNVFSYDKPQVPALAIVNGQTDIKDQLDATDNNSYLFDSEKGDNGFSNVVLSFNKPADAKKAKLIIHGGNSIWSGYIYKEFNSLFGNGYEKWREQKEKSDPKEMEKWQTDQALPIMVYIKTEKGWQFTDYFAMTGNTASRDMIMELDVSKIRSKNLTIKLETAFQFWDLDFAGMDFSENMNLTTKLIDASKAEKTDGSDQINNLSADDKQYCHLAGSGSVNIEYPVTNSINDETASYFLISTGYYHNLHKFEGNPDVKTLSQFREKGAFDKFSRNKFMNIQESLTKAIEMSKEQGYESNN